MRTIIRQSLSLNAEHNIAPFQGLRKVQKLYSPNPGLVTNAYKFHKTDVVTGNTGNYILYFYFLYNIAQGN